MPCHREQNAVPAGVQCRATGSRMPCLRERNAVPPGAECRAFIHRERNAVSLEANQGVFAYFSFQPIRF